MGSQRVRSFDWLPDWWWRCSVYSRNLRRLGVSNFAKIPSPIYLKVKKKTMKSKFLLLYLTQSLAGLKNSVMQEIGEEGGILTLPESGNEKKI